MASDEHALAPMVRKLSAWMELDDDDRRAILALPHTLRPIARGDYVVREGDHPKNSSLLVSGFAYRQKILSNGGRQILAMHLRGDVVDLQNSLLRTADHSVQALTDIEIAMIPATAVKQLAFSRPAVGMAMWYDTLVDASIHREWTANVGRRDGRERMSHLLCEFGMRLEQAGLGRRDSYLLPMTQEELADALGLTPVYVNRTLMMLSGEGLIARTRRSVTVKDWQGLADVGGFTPEYLHLQDRADRPD